MLVTNWWLIVTILLSGLLSKAPTHAGAFTLEGYFRILALAAKKRDMWRKIFLGQDLGFEASPWLFEDRVIPPYVPIIKSFPKYPVKGHYRNERGYSSPHELSFPEIYSHLQLSPRLPPLPSELRQQVWTPYGVYPSGKHPQKLHQNLVRSYVAYPNSQQRDPYHIPQHQKFRRNLAGHQDSYSYNHQASVYTRRQQPLSYQDGR